MPRKSKTEKSTPDVPAAPAEHSPGIQSRMRHLRPPWKPGQSGNPLGRPQRMTESLDFWLDQPVPDQMLVNKLEHLKGSGITFGELCAFNIVLNAAMPSVRNPAASVAAFKEVTDRIQGKVPLTIRGTMDHTVTDISRDELNRQLAELMGELPTIDAELVSETNSEKQLDAAPKPKQLHEGASSATFNAQADTPDQTVEDGEPEREPE